MRIAACMIARNEERCIARCINGYKNIVSEIIVVDTGSTDRTVEIAKSMGARVYHFEWINDFAAAKNYALDRVSKNADWVLFLDADEWFLPGDDRKVAQALGQIAPQKKIDAMMFYLNNVDENNEPLKNAATEHIIRIWRNHPKTRFYGALHEDLANGGRPLSFVTMPHAACMLQHDGYEQSRIPEKVRRNLWMMYDEIYQPQCRPRVYAFMCRETKTVGEHAMSLIMGLGYFAREVENQLSYTLMTMCTIFQVFSQAMSPHLMLRMLDRLVTVADRPEILLYKAEMHRELGRLETALSFYERARKHPVFELTDYVLYSLPKEVCGTFFANAAICATHKSDGAAALGFLKEAARYLAEPRGDALAPVVALLDEKTREAELLPIFKGREEWWEPLLKALSEAKPSMAYLQVFEWWYTKHQKMDRYFLTMLLAIGEYAQAFEFCVSRGEAYAYKGLAAALMLWERLPMEQVGRLQNPMIIRLAEKLSGDSRSDTLLFLAMPEDEYVVALSELLSLFGMCKQANGWLALTARFGEGMPMRVATVLFEKRLYENAVPYLRTALARAEAVGSTSASTVAYMLMVSLRELGRNSEALDAAEKALEHGYPREELLSWVIWIVRDSSDAGLRCAAETLEKKIRAKLRERTYFFISAEEDEHTLRAITERLTDAAGSDRSVLLHHRALVLNRMGDAEAAESGHRQALVEEPNLGRLVAPQGSAGFNSAYREIAAEEKIACPLCGAAGKPYACYNALDLVEFDARYPILKRWMRCGECGHLFARDWLLSPGECVENAFTLSEGMREELLERRIEIVARLAGGSRFLLVGAWSERMSGIAQKKGMTAMIAALSEIAECEGRFDAVVLDGGMELAEDPSALLKAAVGKLTDNGVIWASFPSVDTPYSRFFMDSNALWKRQHFRHLFSDGSIAAMSEKLGLKKLCAVDSLVAHGSTEVILSKT